MSKTKTGSDIKPDAWYLLSFKGSQGKKGSVRLIDSENKQIDPEYVWYFDEYDNDDILIKALIEILSFEQSMLL